MKKLYRVAMLAALLLFVLKINTYNAYAYVLHESKTKAPIVDIKNDIVNNKTYKYQNERIKELSAIRRSLLHLNPHIPAFISYKISYAVHKYSKIYKLDPLFVVSVIAIETGKTFIPTLNRGFGWGLMQIVPRWHKKRLRKLGISRKIELYRVFKNVKVGCDILNECLSLSKGNKEQALIYYNGSHLKYSYSKSVMKCYYSLKK